MEKPPIQMQQLVNYPLYLAFAATAAAGIRKAQHPCNRL
jgi:hypothetical protein